MAKICIIVHSYYLRDARIQREAETLIEAGHSVDVICLKESRASHKEIHKDVMIYKLPVYRNRGTKLRYFLEYGIFFFLSIFTVGFFHIIKHYDVILIATMPDFLVFAGIIPRLFGAKIILDVHDLMPEIFLAKYVTSENSIWMKSLRIIEKISFRFPDHIVTVHQIYADLIAKRNKLDLKKITPVMNFADERIFNRNEYNGKFNTKNGFILIYSGTIAERYGVDTAIRAIPFLKDHIPHLKLIILGEGDHQIKFNKLAEDLEVIKWVEFHSPVPVDGVPRILREASIGLCPLANNRAFQLAFPLKIYEYLSVGLPIIASRTRVLEYYYKDLLFYMEAEDEYSLAQVVLEIYEHPDIAIEKVKKGQEFLDRNNWRKEKHKLIELIDSLVIKSY